MKDILQKAPLGGYISVCYHTKTEDVKLTLV